jgi:phenylpropionate dioxygenase-like ring-hydroxylating dioxygenase large terminal subunit
MTDAQLARVKAYGIAGPDPAVPRVPYPVPNGWFTVATAEELKPGETKNVHYFGRDLVIWRERDSGIPHVVDAYCAHLGAHLGVGSGSPNSHEPGPGIVHGDCLQCPFHGWRYDGTGTVVDIPYSEGNRIPAKARVRGYEVREKNALIQAWYHALDEPPKWEVPEVPEFSDPDWSAPVYTERYVDVALQEMAENDVDTVHFLYVHGSSEIPEQETTFDGRIKRTVDDRGNGAFSRETHQLGFGILRITETLAFVATSTPIDQDHTHQRWTFTYRKALGEEMGHRIIEGFASAGIYQDIPIWEHKRFVANPVLVKGDGRIPEFRRWAKQFYTWPDGAPPDDLF